MKKKYPKLTIGKLIQLLLTYLAVSAAIIFWINWQAGFVFNPLPLAILSVISAVVLTALHVRYHYGPRPYPWQQKHASQH